MIGAITSIDRLKSWFNSNGLPFFTLRYEGANNERIIMRNDAIEDMGKAWELLEDQVTAQADVGRARLVVFVYKKGGHNNGIYTNIDLRPGYAPTGMQPAAVAGLPGGMGSITEYVDTRVHLAKLEWENEQLREQLNGPANTLERTIETISGIPGVAEVLKILVAGIVSKVNPQSVPAIQAILNGTPEATTGGAGAPSDEEEENAADPQQQFATNINETATLLGVDALTLSAKLRQLAKENPEIAKQLMTQ